MKKQAVENSEKPRGITLPGQAAPVRKTPFGAQQSVRESGVEPSWGPWWPPFASDDGK
jgi:hypothetical protein